MLNVIYLYGLEMNKTMVLIVLFLSTSFIEAAKPVLEVPNLPNKSELELYEESEGLFAMKLLEYYKMAVALEIQLKILGVDSETKSVQPVFEELEDMDIKTLRKYYNIAAFLHSEVLKAPDSDRQILLDKINELESQIRDTVAIYTIEKGALRNELLDLMLTRLKQLENQNAKNIELVIEQNYVDCMDYHTIFSVAGISKIFFSQGNDIVKNDPALGLQVSVNAGKLVGFWDGFQLRYEYLAPKFFTEYKYIEEPLNYYRHQWNTNINNINLGGKAVLGKSPDLIHGFNIFVGYFWADSKIYNIPESVMNWDGASLSIDYFVASPSCKFPFELFAGITIYNSFSRNLVFQTIVPGHEFNDLGKTHLSANIGLKYNFWRTPF